MTVTELIKAAKEHVVTDEDISRIVQVIKECEKTFPVTEIEPNGSFTDHKLIW